MNKPHKHAALIKQWADGAVIQHSFNGKWKDCLDDDPSWFSDVQYRVKPVTRKYRVALMGAGYPLFILEDETQALWVETRGYFVRWLTDWIEYEV